MNQHAKEHAEVLIFCSGLAVLDHEPNSPFDADAFTRSYKAVESPVVVPTAPVEPPAPVTLLLWPADWLLLILGMAIGFPVLLWVGR